MARPIAPPLLATVVMLAGAGLLFSAGGVPEPVRCIAPDPTPEDPQPALRCASPPGGGLAYVLAGTSLLAAAALMLVLHARTGPGARLVSVSLGAVGLALLLGVAWIAGLVQGSTLCVAGAGETVTECQEVSASPWWTAYAQGGAAGALLLGLLGLAASPMLARRARRGWQRRPELRG